MICKALRDHGITKDIDVHLMVQPVDSMIQDFAKAGASYITFHPEASNHVDRSLQLIRSLGCKSGLVLTPSTSLDYCKYVMDKIDIILLMSVNPGFGGQSFLPSALQVCVLSTVITHSRNLKPIKSAPSCAYYRN